MRHWIGLLIVVFALLGCEDVGGQPGVIRANTPTSAAGVQQSEETGVRLEQVMGEVWIQRRDAAEREVVVTNAMWYANDTIQLAAGATVAVRCLDGTLWYVPQPIYTLQASGDCPAARNDLNMIVVEEGQVQLRYLGASDFHLVANETLARRGDQIMVGQSAEAYILCGTGDQWHDIPRGEPVDVAGGCPLGDCVLCQQIDDYSIPRGEVNVSIPYIITPRGTSLLTQTPLLRWNPILDASEYTVSIEGLDWQTTTSATELNYPGSPPLVAGETFIVKVVADNGRASDENGTALLGFTMLDPMIATTVQAELDAIIELELSADATHLYQAIVYTNYGLFAEAILSLEQSEPQPTALRLLGDLYVRVGLPLEAEATFLQGLTLDSDPRTKAGLHVGLGEAYSLLGQRDNAIDAFKQAQSHYIESGELGLAAEVEQKWRDLE